MISPVTDVQLDTSYLELMLSQAVADKEGVYFFAGNPWSCNCHNIQEIQEFLEKFSSIILDTEEMRCDECDCSLLNLDYKEMCSSGGDSMLWLIILEVSLLLLVLAKFSWDCVTYRRTGEVRCHYYFQFVTIIRTLNSSRGLRDTSAVPCRGSQPPTGVPS